MTEVQAEQLLEQEVQTPLRTNMSVGQEGTHSLMSKYPVVQEVQVADVFVQVLQGLVHPTHA